MWAELGLGTWIAVTGKFPTLSGPVTTNAARAIGVGLIGIGVVGALFFPQYKLACTGVGLGYLALVFFVVRGRRQEPPDAAE
ncbi:hypothetical protein [Pseudodesulfovibrio sediminis]|uniref:Uncharacterized protein n=1 Tax=Pseudodesulfovibrio sediminis TaxID=2810563 RepID=A0ABN6EQ59_9BACT|nr:hypothetical protein [Pseudodesulfovibrio sediminis]BCS86938.1 hypothetical protein PSDVSF_01800 [Pseudodesulfovibrio sediminis]